MRSLCSLIVLALAITTTAHAQVVQVVPPATYVAPTTYVAPVPVYASPTTTYYAGTYPYVSRPYVTRYGYVPATTVAILPIPDVGGASADLLWSHAPRHSHVRLVSEVGSPAPSVVGEHTESITAA